MKTKNIIIGITGGIAAYKICYLVSKLKQDGHDVHVLLTKDAEQFVTPLTLQTLSGNPVIRDIFTLDDPYEVHHIQMASRADLFVIAPATANTIAKIANGLADNMLTATFLAANCPKLIVPAMNSNMLANPITQANLDRCRHFGINILTGEAGYLACGVTGKGRLPEPPEIRDVIDEMLCTDKFLQGRRILITAGPTQEAIDPVRFISNHSSGKMGYALAEAARNFGADVHMIHGITNLPQLRDVKMIPVKSAAEMFEASMNLADEMDTFILSAAVADYRPAVQQSQKIHKTSANLNLELIPTQDILFNLGRQKKSNQTIIGFAMETRDLLQRAQEKLIKKNCDFIVANNLFEAGAGFQTDTNHVHIISPTAQFDLGLLSKKETAREILKYCLKEKN